MAPAILPNLYHGAPVRALGRYRNGDHFNVNLKADVRGKELAHKVRLSTGAGNNPEIERMWALGRVRQLLKKTDRASSRSNVVDQIVELGESYSIVTEYTSFIVLENDEEFHRWKIDRRNTFRIERDRERIAVLRDKFDHLRAKSLARIGPRREADHEENSGEEFRKTRTQHNGAAKQSSVTTPEPSTLLLLTWGARWLLLHRWRHR